MPWTTTLEQVSGALLMLLFLADIFLTILYARAGTGLLAPTWNQMVWRALRILAGRRRGALLSFAGPLIVVLLIGFWALGLTLGAALIIQPELGGAIRPSSGEASTDIVTALLVAGNSLSIVGGGDYAPHSTATRLVFLANSLIGASVLSMVLSYLVQVYAALRERNALALTVDLMSDGTGEASEMLARLMPDGDASETVSGLDNLVHALAEVKEAHHFYPLLFYFRFHDPLYSVSRTCFVLLDLTMLIDHALDRRRYGAIGRSAATTSLHRGALLLLQTLDRHFATARTPGADAAQAWQDRQSYMAAVQKLAYRGIATRAEGADGYASARRTWEPIVCRVAAAMGYDMAEIDTRRTENPPQSRGVE